MGRAELIGKLIAGKLDPPRGSSASSLGLPRRVPPKVCAERPKLRRQLGGVFVPENPDSLPKLLHLERLL